MSSIWEIAVDKLPIVEGRSGVLRERKGAQHSLH